MDAEEKLFWNSLINVCSIVGMGLGAVLGGLIIPIGRRKTLIIFNIIAILSICLSLVQTMPCILVGKVIYGFAAQVLMIAGPKMLDETVPAHMLGDFGFLTNFYITIG